MKTELIKKLKEVKNFFEKTNDKESKEAINEAIALLEKPRVSADEVKQNIHVSARNYALKNCQNDISCLPKVIDAYVQGAKAMHDYAGQSDAVEFAEWMYKKQYHYLHLEKKFYKFGARFKELSIQEVYQAFLNREEK